MQARHQLGAFGFALYRYPCQLPKKQHLVSMNDNASKMLGGKCIAIFATQKAILYTNSCNLYVNL